MFRKTILAILFCFFWIQPAISLPATLKMEDISRVMERFFSFHIENREMNPTLIRRAMKLYIEQFDPDKAYLLESEVLPYLTMSDKRVQEILARIDKKDYSDFTNLNRAIQNAVVRAQSIRTRLAKNLAKTDFDLGPPSYPMPSQFASSEEGLVERQKSRMVRFYLFHKSRTRLDALERREKVYSLFERKVRRMESQYQFINEEGLVFSSARIDHLMAVRIIKCFAKSLDTHTSFFSPEEAYEMRMSLEKQFEGVGVILSEGIDGVMIADLIKGSPADQNGQIQINDLLVEIDGKSTKGVAFEEILDMLKKKDHGDIILGFKRLDLTSKKENFYRVSLRKRPIVMNEERIETSYEKMGDGIIGKISLHSFYESGDGISSEKDVKEAIRSLREKGKLQGLVLDLRENSGGFLSQAVKVAGLFVSNGVIVISKYGRGEIHYLRNLVGKSYFNGPLVVLTSKMSASASEIVAQALQDYGVAVVVGDKRTFGKGSIQYQTVTDAKADIFFKVTVGRYYTVSGKSTQIDGVIADIVVPSHYAPYNIGEKYLEYPLSPDQVEPAYADPLTDLDEKTRILFEKKYLPNLQRAVPFWKRMLPTLKKNSAMRLSRNPDFQAFIQAQQKTRARIGSLPVNTIDDQIQVTSEDLQMNEAVHIVEDMIQIEERAKNQSSAELDLFKTGSD